MAWVNMSPLVKQYTLDEFWQLPDPPDGSKLELIAGVLYMSPPPEYTHDDAIARIIQLLSSYLDKTKRKGRPYVPRAAIWKGPNTYLEPDLFYVSAETEATLDPEHRTTADLVIDGVVGISGSGPLRPNAAEVFANVSAPVVAVDIPSGIDVQTGAADGPHDVALLIPQVQGAAAMRLRNGVVRPRHIEQHLAVFNYS